MSTRRKMHLVAFLKTGPTCHHHGMWRHPESDNDFLDPAWYEHVARVLEKGKFDCLFFADTLGIFDLYKGGFDTMLGRGGQMGLLDPMPVLAIMARVTRHIGLGATMSTTYFNPYHIARLLGTLDHLSKGRMAWNVVSSINHLEARNFGEERLPDRDTRYDRADEVLEACGKLWESWDADALVMDKERGVFADPSKIHYVNYAGQWIKTRGPLNSGPCPQGQPVIAQAGGSPRGRAFAARHADTIVAHGKGIGGMKAYRDDVRRHMIAHGRNPEDCKVLFMIAPILGETEELAQEHKRRRAAVAEAQIPERLAFFGKLLNVDFSGFDLERPICDIDITTNGHQLNLEQFKRIAGTRTLREAMADYNATSLSIELVGTPDSVAARMGEAMEEVGGDGYLFSLPNISRRTIAEIEDGLVPALQDRGLVRKAYAFPQFRDNLLEF